MGELEEKGLGNLILRPDDAVEQYNGVRQRLSYLLSKLERETLPRQFCSLSVYIQLCEQYCISEGFLSKSEIFALTKEASVDNKEAYINIIREKLIEKIQTQLKQELCSFNPTAEGADSTGNKAIAIHFKRLIQLGTIDPFENLDLYRIAIALINAADNNDEDSFKHWCLQYAKKKGLNFNVDADACDAINKLSNDYKKRADELVKPVQDILNCFKEAEKHIEASCEGGRKDESNQVLTQVKAELKDLFQCMEKKELKAKASKSAEAIGKKITAKQDVLGKHQNSIMALFQALVRTIKKAFVKAGWIQPPKLSSGPGLFATMTEEKFCSVHQATQSLAATAA